MKKIRLTGFVFLLFIVQDSLSQNFDHVKSGHFKKTVEFNLWALEDSYNVRSKSDEEIRAFGYYNAPVEFYCHFIGGEGPLLSTCGFQVKRDSTDKTYIIDIKRLTHEIKSITIPVSDQFKEKLHRKMTLLIEKFRVIGDPSIIMHGSDITFRTVVGDEVWSLRIYAPMDKALQMGNICLIMIEDAEENKFDEAKYIKLLDKY